MKTIKAIAVLALVACGGVDDLEPADDAGIEPSDTGAEVSEAGSEAGATDTVIRTYVAPEDLDAEQRAALDAYEAQISHQEVEGVFGTLGQAYTSPTGYGVETAGSAVRCWDNTHCIRPGNRTFRRNFEASTCSSWVQARFVTADADVQNTVNNRGWSMLPIQNGSAKYRYYCKPDSDRVALCRDSNVLGCFVDTYTIASNAEYVDVSGKVYIFPSVIVNAAARSDAEKQCAMVNSIKHELYHMVGLGHSDAMLSSPLMGGFNSGYYTNCPMVPVTTELNWLRDYRP